MAMQSIWILHRAREYLFADSLKVMFVVTYGFEVMLIVDSAMLQ